MSFHGKLILQRDPADRVPDSSSENYGDKQQKLNFGEDLSPLWWNHTRSPEVI